MAAPVTTPKPGTEAWLQRRLIHQLERAGWAQMHVRRMFQPDRQVWMTGTSAPGWPDLTAMRGAYLLAIEVKGPAGRVDPQQVVWLDRFATLPYGRAWVLKPRDDWDMVVRWIGSPGESPRRYGFSTPDV
jgi:Holliday junction resolvase